MKNETKTPRKLRKETTLKLVLTAMFMGLTTAATLAIQIPLPTGYLNFGDIVILIASTMLGPFSGAFVGGLGACIADLVAYPVYALPTFIIKGLEGFVCGLITHYVFKSNFKRPVKLCFVAIASLCSSMLMVLGYFITDTIVAEEGLAATSAIGNVVQAVISFAVSIVVVGALFKTKVFNGYFDTKTKQQNEKVTSTLAEEKSNDNFELKDSDK